MQADNDCVKTLKRLGFLGIPVSESVECSTLIKTSVNQPYKATFQAQEKNTGFSLVVLDWNKLILYNYRNYSFRMRHEYWRVSMDDWTSRLPKDTPP